MAITASQIARWLRQQRDAAGLSQGEAAKKAGLNSDAISKWEREEKGIMAESFVALVLAYDADIRTIAAVENGKQPSAPPLPRSAMGAVTLAGAKSRKKKSRP